jgi:8-oxo-dGTP pyrophosphatase MutT (NUDIX family)
MSDVICNNCGNSGHMYRECRNPVLSYGHILFRCEDMDHIEEPKILMVQRKDSLCYIEFIRGKYDIYNPSYIQTLVDKFNIEEKQRVLSSSFDEMWMKLWMVDLTDKENMKFKNDYVKGKHKFEKLKTGYLIQATGFSVSINYFVNGSRKSYETTEWEFPKGRRNIGETNKECAIREFREETNYEESDYELFDNLAPLDEEYMGENRVRYKHVYYVGYLKNVEKEVHIDPDNPDQVSEIQGIAWLTKEECLSIIRDYHHTRRDVINEVFRLVDKLNTGYYVMTSK